MTVIPVPPLEADALRHRMAVVATAQQMLQDGIAEVLKRLSLSPDSKIQVNTDGSMVALPPPPEPATVEPELPL